MRGHDQPKALVISGWAIYAHPLFLSQMESLADEVAALRQKDPEGYRRKNSAKRLAAIFKLAFEDIPADPTRREYRQGTTLGDAYKHWFRAKFFQQYRLFFRYDRTSRTIVLAWVNDSDTLRAYASGDDAYRVFRKMLSRGTPPDEWGKLLTEARAAVDRLDKLSDVGATAEATAGTGQRR